MSLALSSDACAQREQNAPLYIKLCSDPPDLRYEYLAHTSLDVVNEKSMSVCAWLGGRVRGAHMLPKFTRAHNHAPPVVLSVTLLFALPGLP